METPIHRILCAVDFSSFSEKVVRYGSALTERFGATLFVFHAVSFPRNLLDGSAVTARGERRKRREAEVLQKIETLMGAQPVSWKPVVAFDDPVSGIRKAVSGHRIDVILAASYGLKGIRRMLLGAVVENLARSVPRPLWVVPAHGVTSMAQPMVGRIVVAADFSTGSRNALLLACRIALYLNARVDLLHAMVSPEDGPPPDDAAEFYDRREQKTIDRSRRDLMASIHSDYAEVIQANAVIAPGAPWECLIDHALKTGADLIVVGVRRRQRLSKLLIGSTTEQVLRRSPCPVLAVPEDREDQDE